MLATQSTRIPIYQTGAQRGQGDERLDGRAGSERVCEARSRLTTATHPARLRVHHDDGSFASAQSACGGALQGGIDLIFVSCGLLQLRILVGPGREPPGDSAQGNKRKSITLEAAMETNPPMEFSDTSPDSGPASGAQALPRFLCCCRQIATCFAKEKAGSDSSF